MVTCQDREQEHDCQVLNLEIKINVPSPALKNRDESRAAAKLAALLFSIHPFITELHFCCQKYHSRYNKSRVALWNRALSR